MAKVSIIIPTYNVEPYLEECMESVVRQTLRDIEIICINDGSTDHSLEILQRFAAGDDRVVIVDKENGGYGMAMNIGISRASGEYIGIVEPDDFVPLSMYEDLYQVAAENDLDFVKADFYRFSRAGNGNMDLKYYSLSEFPEDYNKVFNPSETPAAIKFVMNTWSGIYRRTFLEEHHIRHQETPGASFQDNGFFFQTFVFAKRAMILDRPYYMNRRDNPNSSVKSRQKVYCMNAEYDYIRNLLSAYPEIWERFKYIYWWKKLSNYVGTINRIGDEYKEEYLHRISAEFNRAEQLGEVDESLFSSDQLQNYRFILRDPDGYLYRYMHSGRKAKEEMTRVRNTGTYRFSAAVMWFPKKLKKVVKVLKNKGKKLLKR